MNSDTQVAVVTGGTAGIGRAAVRALAEAGYDVAILARGQAGLDGAVADVVGRGGKSVGIRADVADVDAVEEAADRVERELGPISVWVNCAFVGSLAAFWDTTPEEYRRMTDVTYYGQVNGTRAALRVMRPRDAGTVINVSSSLAYRGIPLQSAYCGAKHAVVGFTESVMTELAHEGSAVRIGLVTLPGVNTVQFDWNLNKMAGHPMPVPPIYQPEVAAKAIVRMAAHARRNVWVGMPTAWTILGNRVAPAFLDWYLGRNGVDAQQTDEQTTRHGSNVFEPLDAEIDRGARGSFNEQARDRDVVSALSATIGRTVGDVAGGALALLGGVLNRI